MDRSQSSSRGVLGPLGLLLVAVLWLIVLSGNIPSGSKAHPTPSPGTPHVDQTVVPFPGLAENPTATHPTSLPSTSASSWNRSAGRYDPAPEKSIHFRAWPSSS